MTLESALSFFIAILIFGVTPGPGVFAILARALVSGAKSCTLLALGMTISDILYLIAACFGLAVIAKQQASAGLTEGIPQIQNDSGIPAAIEAQPSDIPAGDVPSGSGSDIPETSPEGGQ